MDGSTASIRIWGSKGCNIRHLEGTEMNLYGTPVMFDGQKMPETYTSNTLFPLDPLKTIHLPVSRHFCDLMSPPSNLRMP